MRADTELHDGFVRDSGGLRGSCRPARPGAYLGFITKGRLSRCAPYYGGEVLTSHDGLI